MPDQRLSAFEKRVLTSLADKAALAAAILDAWAELPANSVQSARSLIDLAQLGVTEEGATTDVLDRSVDLGLLDKTEGGFRARPDAHCNFKRWALGLYAVEHYVSSVHKDSTTVGVVLTKPPRPSLLERKLCDLGWRTADIEPTEHAFHGMVRAAERRLIVMTPFFDIRGARWLQELFAFSRPGVERILVLRSLEDPTRKDYPAGYDSIAPWLKSQTIRVLNYSVPRADGNGRETFHAKVLLCDRNVAYLGSSNMTSASLEHSMEMGVSLRGRAASEVATILESVLDVATVWL